MVQRFIVCYDSANKQKNYKKPLHKAKPSVSEHQSKWKCNGSEASTFFNHGLAAEPVLSLKFGALRVPT